MVKLDKIDTTSVPETLTAPWIKRFFRDFFGIPVRVQNASSSGWVCVWIMSSPSLEHRHALVYHHHFPRELGNRCLRLIYPNSEKLCVQVWAGNISAHSISMSGGQFRQLFRDLIAEGIIHAV